MATSEILTPEVIDALIVLLTAVAGYLTYLVKKQAAFQEEWKKQEEQKEVANAVKAVAPVESEGNVTLKENEFQTAEGLEAMMKAIPKDATIYNVTEGIASNGSKYRVVYWKLKRG